MRSTGELLAGLVFGDGEPQLQLAAPLDHVLEHLVDRVLVDAGPARDDAPDRATDAVDELRGGDGVGELRGIGEQTPQIAIVEVRVVDAVVLPLVAIVLPQCGAEAAERIDFFGILDRRRRAAERVHQAVHVLQLAERAPSGVPLAPLAVGRQPHGKRFGEVFVRVALRVPRIEMEHEALAVGLGRVELRIRLARRSERVLPLPAPPQSECVVDGVTGLVPEDAHAPFVFAALDLEHLGLLQRFEPRVRQIEGDGDRRRAVRREPLIRQVEVQREAQVARRDLRAKLRDAIGERPFDGQRKVRHADVQQRFVTEFGPVVTQGGTRHEVMCKGNTMRLFCALVTVIAMTVMLAGQERDRAKVADALKWNLADVYPSEAAWRAQKEKITAELPTLREFQGTLGASPKTLADALEMMSRLDKELTRLYVFASMLSDQDTRLSGPQGMQQEMQQIFAKFGAEASFVEPELLKVGSAAIEKAIAAEPRLKPYRLLPPRHLPQSARTRCPTPRRRSWPTPDRWPVRRTTSTRF